MATLRRFIELQFLLQNRKIEMLQDRLDRTQQLLLDFIDHQGYNAIFDQDFKLYTFKKRKRILVDEVPLIVSDINDLPLRKIRGRKRPILPQRPRLPDSDSESL